MGAPNEVEERRVIRLLTGTAEAIPPLHEAELETLVRAAVTRSRSHRARRHSLARRPPLPTAAVAAAAVLAVVLPLWQPEPERHSSSSADGRAPHLVAFPEGSALSLLLARPGERRA